MHASASTSLLSLHQLRVGYRHTQRELCLFQDLNLSLAPGQLVCFMGPNGIGKSSLIRTLAGLQTPISGQVHLNRGPAHEPWKNISVVLTDKISHASFTAYELIAFGRYPYLGWNVKLSDTDISIIDNAIAEINIQHLADQKIHELSDGQLQMVMIARALAQDTPIMLLDEPTAHLDLNNRVEIMNLLRRLSRSTGKAILVATHELDLALQTADVIWLAGREKNVLAGMPEDLVLNGSFDEIFQFKGFDLRTGRIKQDAHREVTIQLLGEGHAFLWTKNALERNGYRTQAGVSEITVTVNNEESQPQWTIKKSDRQFVVDSIATLIEQL